MKTKHSSPQKLATLLFLFGLLPFCVWGQAPDIEMVYVKGGTFTMGCTSEQSDCYDDERPIHEVTLSDYYIGKYEITQAQYRAVMGKNPSEFSGCDNCPVENVSWQDARQFCYKLSKLTGKNYTLPTEAQWEFAARGGTKSEGIFTYAGAFSLDEVGWYDDNSSDRTHRVGSKQANELGIYDMSGNVWEWCLDVYDSEYYAESSSTDPTGPAGGGDSRVLRGGGWYNNPQFCRVARRGRDTPASTSDISGFRVVSFQ